MARYTVQNIHVIISVKGVVLLEVLKSIFPMFMALLFIWCAGIFGALAITNKKERKVGLVGALLIELVSFTIWIPCLNDLFDALALLPQTRTIVMVVAIVAILSGTVAVAIWEARKTKT